MLQLYWKNATEKIVGPDHGITTGDLEEIEPSIRDAHRTVVDACSSGELGYAGLPGHTEYPARVMALVEKYRPMTTDLVVLGIGGSALGNVAVHSALNPATYNLLSDKKRGGPRLFVLDNVDPAMVGETLKFLGRRLKTTLVNVISKGGEAAETLAGFMIFREALRKKLGDDFAGRIVATTGDPNGTLCQVAQADGYDMLEVPDKVGGRFSVLSPVGLFSAAMCGLDIEALLAGAGAMKQRIEAIGDDWESNPACMLAAVKYLMFARKGKPIHVMMPYSNRLYLLADWYRQLWAESLGKRLDRQGNEVFTGPTPIRALGATDQHSQAQLYLEGANDKLTVFLEVAKHPGKVRIPDVFGDVPGLAYLRKTPLSRLLSTEKKATEYALAQSQRPSITLQFNSIVPQSVGEFIYLYEFTTSLMGELMNINAYDQPGVKLIREATFALMGRDGHGDLAKEMKPFNRPDPKYQA